MAISTLAADIASVLQHGGVSVVCGEDRTYGSLKQRDVADFSEGLEVQTRVTTLVVPSDVLSLSRGATITVDDTDYQIRSWAPEGDGSTTRIILARMS